MKPIAPLLLVLGLSLCGQVHAQRVPCSQKSLSSDQGWNPPNSAVTPQLSRFYDLGDKLSSAYKSDNSEQSATVAKEYLEAAKAFRCNWNFGNAIHDANTLLGLIALRKKNTDEAVQFLVAASKSTGSPQLNTFGPSMLLANELVKVGRRQEVTAYLKAVKRFWRMDDGAITRWVGELEAGRSPDFRMSLRPL